MTDRELLELAAKAAGWTWWQSKHGYWNIKGPDCEERAACCGWFKFDAYTGSEFAEPTPVDALIEVGFNPRDDNGDALQLACKLSLVVYCDEFEAWCEWGELNENLEYEHHVSAEPKYKGSESVRRAILLAAAEIGRAM